MKSFTLFIATFLILATAPTASHANSVSSAVNRLEMLQLLAGTTVEVQLSRLLPWLEERYGYRASCANEFLASVSDLQCLYGVRALAATLNAELLPHPTETLIVEIGSRWKKIDTVARLPKVIIPYTASEAKIAGFIRSELRHPAYAARLRLLNLIEDLRAELESSSGKEIAIDDRLSNTDAMAGLYLLKLYLNSSGRKISGASEVISISDAFRLPYEEQLKLKEDIKYNASLEEMQKYFAQEIREISNRDDKWPNSFFRERERLQKTIRDFEQTHKVEAVACTRSPTLSQVECRKSLERLENALSLPGVHVPQFDRIAITSPDDMPVTMDYFRDPKDRKSVLLVRSGFGLWPLLLHFNQLGWYEFSAGGAK